MAEDRARRGGGVADALADGVFVCDGDGRLTYGNEAMASLVGCEPSALEGTAVEDVLPDVAAVIEDPTESGGALRATLRPREGDPVPCEVRTSATADGGTAAVVRTVGEADRGRETITQLQEVSRGLMQAPSRESIAEVVTSAVEEVLGYDLSVVRLYDAEERVLEPVAVSDAADDRMEERPTYALDEAGPGKVFASGEPAVYDDVRTLSYGDELEPVRSAMFFPIGVHGTLSVAAPTVGAFDDVDRQVAALLATNAAAACNRAKREREVREARERIATILERIEGLIQDTVEVLVEATTREDVERGVCEQLAAADPYVFAWVGRLDVREESLVAREWAGSAPLDVADVAVPTDGDDPGAVARRTGDSRVIDVEDASDAGNEDGDATWLADARAAGVESVMAIPLSYTDSTYGVLYVCADRADAFDDRERVVLEALGRAVANTINAIESGRILTASQVIELQFTVDDRDLLFSRVSATTGARLESAGTLTTDDGSLRVYLSATGADSDAVRDALRGDDAVASATRVADLEGESLFDVTVADSLVATLVDHGAVPTSLTAEDGQVRYAVELPHEAEARAVFGIVEDRHDAVDLVRYREHERPVRTQQEFRAALSERFTDRQETALRTAYLGGFFEWPRDVDGDELADGMDITRPTYHQHLRTAQQKVFEQLFK